MGRCTGLASVPGLSDQEGRARCLVDSPPHRYWCLASADSDLQSLADLLAANRRCPRGVASLTFPALLHPAASMHYSAPTGQPTEVVPWCAWLGGRGHWSYGLEDWGRAACGPKRQRLWGPAPAEEEVALASLGTVEAGLSLAIGHAAEGGPGDNLRQVLIAPWRLSDAGLTVELRGGPSPTPWPMTGRLGPRAESGLGALPGPVGSRLQRPV